VLSEALEWVPWVAFCFGMFLTFVTIYGKSGSFRKALLGSLFVGKTFAVVYWIAGLNRTVATIYIINRKAPWVVHEVRVTACLLILLSFAATLTTTIAWPTITKQLPKETRKALQEISK